MRDPLVPSDVDLRGLPFMPLDVNRLRDSGLAINASGEEFRAAVLLWCASWNQVPAASLPADDRALASYAGYGRDVRGWKAVKAGAIRGFVECSDGRLYHPVVAEKALDAWQERTEYRDRRDNEADRLRKHRDEHKQLRKDLHQYGVVLGWQVNIEVLRETLHNERLQRARTQPETGTGALPATAKTGTGIGTGTGRVIEHQQNESPIGDSSTPSEPPGEINSKRAAKEATQDGRLSTIVDDAITAYNATLGKPHGLLPAVSKVGRDKRRQQVGRCLKIASEICEEQFGAKTIIPAFWVGYFDICGADDFYAGRRPGGKGHENYVPDFELVTRPETMLKLYDRAEPDDDGAAP